MNTQLTLTQFLGTDLNLILHNDDAWLTMDDIGQALDYEHPRDSINNLYNRNQELLDDYSTTINLMAVDGKQRDMRVFNEEGVMLIAMRSNQPRAIDFQRWAVRILKAYRQGKLTAARDELLHVRREKDELQTKYVALLEKHQKQAPRPKRLVTLDEIELIKQMSATGMGNKAIAGRISRSEATVSLVLSGKYAGNVNVGGGQHV